MEGEGLGDYIYLLFYSVKEEEEDYVHGFWLRVEGERWGRRKEGGKKTI